MALSTTCRGLDGHPLTKVSEQAQAAHGGSSSGMWGAEPQGPMAPGLHLCTQALQNSHLSLFRHREFGWVLAAGSSSHMHYSLDATRL